MARTKKNPRTSFPVAPRKTSWLSLRNAGILAGLWLAFAAVTISFPSYSWLCPRYTSDMLFYQSWALALLLLVAMTLFVRFFLSAFPTQGSSNIPAFWLWVCFVAIAVSSLYLGLFHMALPTGTYTEDCAFFIRTIRRMQDMSVYGPAFIFEHGLMPLWPYTALLLWKIFPSDTGLMIQRSTNVVFYLGTIYFLYLAGKEIAGRRVGLLAAILASLSKPILTKVVSGYPSEVLTFGIAIALWTTFRLARKNSLSDFLWWGVSVSFMAFTTAPFEPFIPFFIFVTLGLILWNGRKTMDWKKAPIPVWISLVVFLLYYLCCNNAFPDSFEILHQVKRFEYLILALLLSFSIYWATRKNSKTQQNAWIKWFLGSWLATAIAHIEIANDFMVVRIQDHSLMAGAGFLSPHYILASLGRIPDTLRWIFWSAADKPDMCLNGDCFFSYPETLFLALGLVFCLARPTANRVLLILTALLGVLPHVVADAHHSGLLVGCIAPCLLMAAVGLDEFLAVVERGLVPLRVPFFLVYILLIALWAWSGLKLFDRVHTQWADKRIKTMEMAAADSAQGDRVYTFLAGPVEYYEGPVVRYFHPPNPIYLTPEEKVPTVVTYFDISKGETQKEAKASFPHAQWTGLNDPNDNSHPVVWRCEIPAEDLLRKNKLFNVIRIKPPFWRRAYLAAHSGLCTSVVDWDDAVTNVKQPLPQGVYVNFDAESSVIEGTITVTKGGSYEIGCWSGNRTEVWIDGQKTFDMTFPVFGDYNAPPVEKKVTLDLKPGEHSVKVITCFQISYDPPEITLKPAGSGAQAVSLWSKFVF